VGEPVRLRFLFVQFALAAAIVILQDRELRELLALRWREARRPAIVGGHEPSAADVHRMHDEARAITRGDG
jgi:hypothetical protein